MGRFSITYKHILLLSVFIVLWLPQAQYKLRFAKDEPLNGDIEYPKEDSLNTTTWFSGEYQAQQEVYLNTIFGLRNTCIRINNQLAFSFFKKAKANRVIVGKDNYLYEKSYIDTYTGADFVGTDSIKRMVDKLKFISDTLNKLNKTLLVVFAAGKASFYPEFIPDKYVQQNNRTNYKELSKATKQAGLNMIDFNRWFMETRFTASYPLYPKYGIHWSKYGTMLVADSMIKKIESLKQIRMPHLYYDSLVTKQPHGIDYDIGDGMNLLCKLNSFEMAYMKIKFENDSGKSRPAALVISDSFYWGIYDFGLPKVFKDDHFWYYNKMVYPESFKDETFTDYLDIGDEIKKHDLFVIMATEATLKDFGWGFIDNAFSHFTKPEAPHSSKYYIRLKQLYNYIKTDKKWLKEVRQRANENDVHLDVQILKEAKFVLKNENTY